MTSEELLAHVKDQVAHWPESRRVSHGLDLLSESAGAGDRRRIQAKVALVSQDILIDLGDTEPDRYVLMKGLEVAQLYPSVVQRPSGDVDLLALDPSATWTRLVECGYRQSTWRWDGADHHHLPALEDPLGVVGVELHRRPNAPLWSHISTDLIMSTAEPSRTQIPGILRPRDDLHALLMALHCWKGGFSRMRDLLDAMLLANASRVPVERTARALGLARLWKWSNLIAKQQLLGESTPARQIVARALRIENDRCRTNNWARVAAPYVVANPVAVTAEHFRDQRSSRSARRQFDPKSGGTMVRGPRR